MDNNNYNDLSRYTTVNVNNLLFDQYNPRLPDNIDGSDDDAVMEWMLREGESVELIESIGESGYSTAEPLLVVKYRKDIYTVVEGNRRLVALKILNNPSLAPINKKNN
ncbi:MAG: ParB/Srx family N-terminal domain-containing protein [Deltaproteobacteria bacterium]|jgi:hypothetical protein|nr:ParB/Srx family N-terminal domain-containing protein [Deltaproteobacteria bacterium]